MVKMKIKYVQLESRITAYWPCIIINLLGIDQQYNITIYTISIIFFSRPESRDIVSD